MYRMEDVRTEVRKLASSKPVFAAAGAGMVATERLRDLPARIAKWREEASTVLPARATKYVLTARAKAVGEYDKLAARGMKAFNGHAVTEGKAVLNGKTETAKTPAPKTAPTAKTTSKTK